MRLIVLLLIISLLSPVMAFELRVGVYSIALLVVLLGVAGLMVSLVWFKNVSLAGEVKKRLIVEQNLRLYLKSFEHSPNSQLLVKYINKSPVIINVNDAFIKLYGYSRGEVINHNPRIINSGSYDKSFYKKMWGDILNPKKGFWTGELVNKRKDGSMVNVILTVSTLFIKGKPRFFLASHVDISAQKELTELKNNFLTLMTHDLKQPLVPIIGYAGLIKKSVRGKNKKYVALIEDSAVRLRDMIDRVLEFYKVDSGLIKLNKVRVKLSDLLLSVIESKQSLIDLKGINLINKVSDVEISCDPELIKVVMNNLIDNAIKFTKKNGRIVIKSLISDGVMRLSVKDDGVGIKKSDVNKLFNKFYQTTEGRALGGSGIGLTMIKRIIELHKGSVAVNSVYGKGSEFIIKLPLK